jgi:hypothetical protein
MSGLKDFIGGLNVIILYLTGIIHKLIGFLGLNDNLSLSRQLGQLEWLHSFLFKRKTLIVVATFLLVIDLSSYLFLEYE